MFSLTVELFLSSSHWVDGVRGALWTCLNLASVEKRGVTSRQTMCHNELNNDCFTGQIRPKISLRVI